MAVPGEAVGAARAGGVPQQVRDLFGKEGLPLPPFPDELARQLAAVGPHIFGTRPEEEGLYTVDTFVSQVVSGPVADYLLTGFDGHGTDSWAFHYYLVRDPLAVFLQLRWGGAYTDPESARRRISGSLGLMGRLVQDVPKAAAAGKLNPQQRLVVVESDFAGSRWAWVQPGPEADEKTPWQTNPPVLLAALMNVRDIAASLRLGA